MNKIADDYITCALWSSNNENGTPLDCGAFTLSDEARATLEKQANNFAEAFPSMCGAWESWGYNLGHDLWLTRNGHGAGFWCRTCPKDVDPTLFKEVQDTLSAISRELGEVNLYVGDDAKIYVG